jgi:integrase
MGPLYFGPPKSAAGRRTVTVPAAIRSEIKKHLDTLVAADPDALVFTSSRGAVLRRSNFQRATDWTTTVKAAGLPGFHLHDLRHTGNSLAAASGASLRSLMTRMGHGSTRAALIYQHTSRRDDASIASMLSKQIQRQQRAHNGHEGKNRKKK